MAEINELVAVSGSTAGIIVLIYTIYKLVRKGVCKSHCCGKNLDISYNIGESKPEISPV